MQLLSVILSNRRQELEESTGRRFEEVAESVEEVPTQVDAVRTTEVVGVRDDTGNPRRARGALGARLLARPGGRLVARAGNALEVEASTGAQS